LSKSWRKQRGELDKRTLKAFDYFTRGLELSERFTENDNRQARGYLEKAIEIEPNYGRALAKLAWTHSLDAIYGWSANAESSWGEALRFATLSVERDDDEAWGHWALGGYYRFHRRHDLAVREYQRAIELNPNDADVLADFGYCLAFAGRPNDGMEMMLKAMRLNPHHPDWYTIGLAIVYFGSRRYEEVIVTFEGLHSLSTVPDFLYLAASHAFLGHGDEARASIEGALKLDPQATIRKWASTKNVCYKNPEDLEHYKNGLRMAGLPE
jgi:adenylate cyclase